MKPTPEQFNYMIRPAFDNAASFNDGILAVIEAWESIRPKDPQPGLPEWIPVTEDIGSRSVVALNPTSESIANRSLLRPGQSYSYYMEHATLAALPKRLPAPKPTPEEIERELFEAWAFDVMGLRRDGHEYYCENTRAAWIAWKAAKKGIPTP